MKNILMTLFVSLYNCAVFVYFLILIGCALWNHTPPSTTSILIGIIGLLLAYIITTKVFQ